MKRKLLFLAFLFLTPLTLVAWQSLPWQNELRTNIARTVILYVNGTLFSPITVHDSIAVAITDSLDDRIVTTIGSTGDDVSIPSEQATRELADLYLLLADLADSLATYGLRLTSLETITAKVDSLILEKDSDDYGSVFTYEESTGATKIETF